jgi:hypothetical protein
MCLKAFKTRFTLLKASLFPGFNPMTRVYKSRVAYPGGDGSSGGAMR